MADDPKGENTAGLNPDGTLAIGTPEQMRVLQQYWKRSEEAYERGEEFNEPIPSVKPVQPAAGPEESDEDADADEEVDDLDVHYGE